MKFISSILLVVLLALASCGSPEQVSDESQSEQTEEALFTKLKDLEKHMLHGSGATNMNVSDEMFRTATIFNEKYPTSPHLEDVLLIGTNAARGLGRIDEAIAMLGKLIAMSTDDERKVEYMYTRAFVLDMDGRTEMAKSAYSEIYQKYPTHPYGEQSLHSIKALEMTKEELNQWLNQRAQDEPNS